MMLASKLAKTFKSIIHAKQIHIRVILSRKFTCTCPKINGNSVFHLSVILESPIGQSSEVWFAVQPALAEVTRVSYT